MMVNGIHYHLARFHIPHTRASRCWIAATQVANPRWMAIDTFQMAGGGIAKVVLEAGLDLHLNTGAGNLAGWSTQVTAGDDPS